MSCKECEESPLEGCYVRIGKGNVQIIGCRKHIKELLDKLKGGKNE